MSKLMISTSRRLSFIRTTKQLISEGGIIGLWRGGLPNVQRAALVNMGELTTYDTSKRWFAVRFQLKAPWSLTFWVTYEKIRCLAGVSGF
ncbi:Mitochondrial uncoupling protein 4 [Schistosoma japonicum]|nr:Mitochondrial uncoupling protein 4 [Schistosoma japonicum]